MAIVLSSAYPGRVDLSDPTGYPSGARQNETAPGANDGTPLDELMGNDTEGFHQALLDEAGIVPSGVPDKVGASDYLDAIKALFAGSLSVNNLLHVEDQKANGVVGGSTVAFTAVTRDLTTVVTNNIAGASLAANQIILPAGDYYAEISGPVEAGLLGNNHQALLQQVTGALTTHVVGTSMVVGGPDAESNYNMSVGSKFFTIAGSETMELQHFASRTVASIGLGGPASSGNHELYGIVKIWKVEL